MTRLTGAMLISDGWTSVQNRPIINGLLSTPAGAKFLKSIDTSGDIKDNHYIADFTCAMIEEVGPDKIVAVCMDGACRGCFPLIRIKYPWVFCFICPTHSVDNFLKNVCTDKDVIRVASVRNSDDEREFQWDSDVFSKCIDDCWETVKFVTNHSKPLAIFRTIATDADTWSDTEAPTARELLKFCDTRFASKLLMIIRYLNLRSVLELLIANPGHKAWLKKQ
jgi:hypothetical protein